MNYTPNYRLPQWEMSDRLLMGDFNHICAVTDASAALADRLSRDAYRVAVQQRVHHGPNGDPDAMWINALSSLAEAGDGNAWNGRYGIYMGPSALPTIEGILETAQEECYISTVSTYIYQSRKAALSFTSDGTGILKTIRIFFWMNSHYTSKAFQFTIEATRLDTGETTLLGPFLTPSEAFPTVYFDVEANYPIESGIPYRFAFDLPEDAEFYGRQGFLTASTEHPNRNQDSLVFVPVEKISLSRTIYPAPFATSALGIMRWHGDGSVVISVNGSPLSETLSRDTVNAEGNPCREMEFRLDPLPEGPLTLTVDAAKGDGELQIFDYGLIWR